MGPVNSTRRSIENEPNVAKLAIRRGMQHLTAQGEQSGITGAVHAARRGESPAVTGHGRATRWGSARAGRARESPYARTPRRRAVAWAGTKPNPVDRSWAATGQSRFDNEGLWSVRLVGGPGVGVVERRSGSPSE